MFYVTLPGSKLWFEGTSTVNDYTCAAGKVDGYAEIINSSDIRPGALKKIKYWLLLQYTHLIAVIT